MRAVRLPLKQRPKLLKHGSWLCRTGHFHWKGQCETEIMLKNMPSRRRLMSKILVTKDQNCLYHIIIEINHGWVYAADINSRLCCFTTLCNHQAHTQPSLCPSHITLPGPVRAVPRLVWTKIASPLTGPARDLCGVVRILSPRTGTVEF